MPRKHYNNNSDDDCGDLSFKYSEHNDRSRLYTSETDKDIYINPLKYCMICKKIVPHEVEGIQTPMGCNYYRICAYHINLCNIHNTCLVCGRLLVCWAPEKPIKTQYLYTENSRTIRVCDLHFADDKGVVTNDINMLQVGLCKILIEGRRSYEDRNEKIILVNNFLENPDNVNKVIDIMSTYRKNTSKQLNMIFIPEMRDLIMEYIN